MSKAKGERMKLWWSYLLKYVAAGRNLQLLNVRIIASFMFLIVLGVSFV